MFKKYKIWLCFLIIISLFLIIKKYKMNEDKLIVSNDFSFLLLDGDYKDRVEKEYLKDINSKDYRKVDVLIADMLKELDSVDEDEKSKYKDYYNAYEQVLSYENNLLSHKQLATNILEQLSQSIKRKDVSSEEVNPFVDYLIFKKYSLYFKSYWFCMPYLRFSDKLFSDNNIDIHKLLNIEKNESQRIKLYDDTEDNEDELQYYSLNEEQVDYLLEKLKNGKEETSEEFFVLYNALLKCKTKDFILLYTKM